MFNQTLSGLFFFLYTSTNVYVYKAYISSCTCTYMCVYVYFSLSSIEQDATRPFLCVRLLYFVFNSSVWSDGIKRASQHRANWMQIRKVPLKYATRRPIVPRGFAFVDVLMALLLVQFVFCTYLKQIPTYTILLSHTHTCIHIPFVWGDDMKYIWITFVIQP